MERLDRLARLLTFGIAVRNLRSKAAVRQLCDLLQGLVLVIVVIRLRLVPRLGTAAGVEVDWREGAASLRVRQVNVKSAEVRPSEPRVNVWVVVLGLGTYCCLK